MKTNSKRKNIIFLSELFDNEINKEEIISRLKIKEATFYKYIQLIKRAGFIIERNNETYRLLGFRNSIKVDKRDEWMLSYLMFIAQNYLTKQKSKIFIEKMTAIAQCISQEAYLRIRKKSKEIREEEYKKDIHKKIELFQNSINKNKVLEVKTKRNAILIIKPLKLSYDKEKVYLEFINKKDKKVQTLNIESFLKIEYLENFEFYSEIEKEIIFELKNKLANSYILKENERIIDKSQNKIVVGNSENNTNKLFKRLVRYDTYCKILFPKSTVDEFKYFIKKSIANIK